jgi:hypothetical protein
MPMSRLPSLVVAGALAAVLIAGCDQQPAASATISGEAAATRAVAESGSSVPATMLSAALSTYGAEARGGLAVAADTPVWAVRVAGSFPLSCGPARASPGPCPSAATTALILIDARSGVFIQGLTPAP